jgi:hypothetical protein
MAITTRPARPAPSLDEQKLGRQPGQPPGELAPSPDQAKRPGGPGRGSQRPGSGRR